MQAITQLTYGGPEVLELKTVAAPALQPDSVHIEVHASAVTRGDLRMRAADFPGIGWLPGRLVAGLFRPRHQTPGTVFAGRVIAVGASVTRFAPGDDVFGTCDAGAYAEQLVVKADGVIARMPEGVSYEEAAAVPYGALTANHFLTSVGQVREGQRVLVIGAAGGVGRFAVQIAHHLGAEVTAVCNGRDEALARQLGAHHVIDYTTERFTEGGRRFDVIFDTSDTASFCEARHALAPRGRFLTVQLSFLILMQMRVTSLWRRGRRALFAVSLGDAEQMEAVSELLEARVIRPVIGRTLPLSEVSEGHRVAARGAAGCVVVRHGSASPDEGLRASTR